VALYINDKLRSIAHYISLWVLTSTKNQNHMISHDLFFINFLSTIIFSLNYVWDRIIVRKRQKKDRPYWTLLTHSQKTYSANEHAAFRHRKSNAHTESDRVCIYKNVHFFSMKTICRSHNHKAIILLRFSFSFIFLCILFLDLCLLFTFF
jgi:hypothetical protein